MKEKQKIITPKIREHVRTTDIYLAAYIIALGGAVEGLEVVKELDKDVCALTLKGESVKIYQEAYFSNRAVIEPVLYQRAINRIKDVVFKAIKEASKSQGGAS